MDKSGIHKRIAFALLIASVAGAACNFHKDKTQGGRLSQLDSISYADIRAQVLVPRCISCHGDSGDVNLETYRAVKANLAEIENSALVERSMPKDGALTDFQLGLLRAWIDAGAPEFASTIPPSAEPSPSPMPVIELKPNFASIREGLLVPRCISCHSAAPANQVPLGSLREILDSPRDLVLPGNVEESGLWIALTRTDDKRMPPKGLSLRDADLAAIRQWIELGAPATDSGPASASTRFQTIRKLLLQARPDQ